MIREGDIREKLFPDFPDMKVNFAEIGIGKIGKIGLAPPPGLGLGLGLWYSNPNPNLNSNPNLNHNPNLNPNSNPNPNPDPTNISAADGRPLRKFFREEQRF